MDDLRLTSFSGAGVIRDDVWERYHGDHCGRWARSGEASFLGSRCSGRRHCRREAQLRPGQVLAFFQSIGACLMGIEACASAQSASAKWAMDIFTGFWSPAPPPSCGWRASAAERAGSAICLNARSQGRRRRSGQQDRPHRVDPGGATGGLTADDGIEIGLVPTQDLRRRRKRNET